MKHSININLLLLATSLFTACSSEDTPNPTINPANDPDAIELGITAGVALTKSAITGWENDNKIAVFATGNDYTSGNDYAVYTYNGTTWSNTTINKIYLTHETATIYAYYPSTLSKPTDTSTPTVGITVFEGDGSSANAKYPSLTKLNNADKVWNSTSWTNNDKVSTLITADGEIDYLWAEDAESVGNQATASNGKKTSSINASVKLNMKHALSMVSFRIYNDGTYAGDGNLTQIVLQNSASNNVLSKGSSPTMSLKNGSITENSVVKATYRRGFTDASGYAIPKKGKDNATTEENAKEAAKKFSILVLPDGNTKFDKNKIEVVFTIDGTDYPVALTDPSDDDGKWIAGKNYLYTAKLSGKELTISSVTVSEWTPATGGDLNVN